jgi:NitT/TauT family transport system substrate-binding protein
MYGKLWRYFLVAVTTLVMFGGTARADDLPVINIGIANTSSDAGFFIADAKGYFQAEGLKVNLIPFASAAGMIAPLASGQLQVGGGTVSAGLYNASLRDIDMKIVADKGSIEEGYDYSTLLVRKDLVDSGRYKSFADLKGMRIAVAAKGSGSESALNEALKKGGLKISDVNLIYLGFPEHFIALQNHKIDASITNEPTVTLAVKKDVAVRVSDKAIYPGQQTAVVLYSQNFINNHHDQAQKLMNAYVRALRYYNDALSNGKLAGPTADDVISILTKYTKIKDPAVYRAITPNAADPDGHVHMTALRNDLAFFKQQGFVHGDIKVEDVVDDSFANEAAKQLGPYHPMNRSNVAAN